MSRAVKLFHPFLALIASATEHELAKYVQYLKEENKILRARMPGKQIHTKPAERERLLKYGRPLGRAIEELITIVSPATFYRWCKDGPGKRKALKPKGRPRKSKRLRELVVSIATETNFGLTRIVGEIRKLGIKRISRSTVRNILKEEGIEPEPDRTSDSWDEFVRRHGETLYGCDFFSVKSVTARGIRDLYVMVFLCMRTREVFVSPSTTNPKSAWVCEQTQAFLDQTANRGNKKPRVVMHDRDAKFSKAFKDTLKQNGVKPNPLPKASPNLNGRVEKFIFQIKSECLSKFIIFGRQHLDYLVGAYAEYFNHLRSHSTQGNLPPVAEAPEEVAVLGIEDVEVSTHLGGLITSFHRKAA